LRFLADFSTGITLPFDSCPRDAFCMVVPPAIVKRRFPSPEGSGKRPDVNALSLQFLFRRNSHTQPRL
jgi:hypothetical protein